MKLTKELIELQGFVYDETKDGEHQFYINYEKVTYGLMWNFKENIIYIEKYNDDDDDEDHAITTELFHGEVKTFFQFLSVLRHIGEITEESIALPNDFINKFKSTRYNYDMHEFDEMTKLSVLMLLSKEDYEDINPIIEYRKKYYKRKGWEYKDIDPEFFQLYSEIVTYDYRKEKNYEI